MRQYPHMAPDCRHIPLSLYIHLPWCVRKCPYCDFNSHAARGQVPEADYVAALLADLEQDWAECAGRRIETVFIGGGTPSLFSARGIADLLAGVGARAALAPGAEITLEANPGAADEGRFAGFRAAGVNRLSIGVQSFNDAALARLGRIHDGRAAHRAVRAARRAGFENINLDLMFALPGQDLGGALADIEAAVALAPAHISHYQLTLEPGTPFYHRPPALPDDDGAWEMQRGCGRILRRAGYRPYETSAWARSGARCRHNLNYWRYGDYLGIGAGAHGKITGADGRIVRTAKVRQPGYYLARAGGPRRVAEQWVVPPRERGFECLLNGLRLHQGVLARTLRARTGLDDADLAEPAGRARRRGLLRAHPARWQATALGRRFLNDLTAEFLPP